MKLLGKYRYIKNGESKTKHYIIRKTIPNYSRRTIVFGPTGYGKSVNLIADAICKNKNVLYISVLPFRSEWEGMHTKADISVYKNIADIKADFTGKVAYDFGEVPQVKQESIFFEEVVPCLISSGITKRSDVTVVLDNLFFLGKEKGLLDKLTENWKCKIVLDLTCGVSLYCDDHPHNFASKKWKLVPVFTPLFDKKKKGEEKENE